MEREFWLFIGLSVYPTGNDDNDVSKGRKVRNL